MISVDPDIQAYPCNGIKRLSDDENYILLYYTLDRKRRNSLNIDVPYIYGVACTLKQIKNTG